MNAKLSPFPERRRIQGRAEPSDVLFEITIPRALPSWNTFYAGINRWRRMEFVNAWYLYTGLYWPDHAPSELHCPVVLDIEVGKPHHLLDCSNVCAKVVEDSLVKRGLLPDDSPEYVREVRLRSVKSEKPYTRVRLYECE